MVKWERERALERSRARAMESGMEREGGEGGGKEILGASTL